MTWVIDANIACAWYLESPVSQAARDFLDAQETLIAPDLIIPEIANSLWRLVASGRITDAQARLIIERVPGDFQEIVSTVELREAALDLAFRLKHPAYDCFYLVLADRRNVHLITADARFTRKAAEAGFGRSIRLIEP